MKTLFLIWLDSDRKIENYYSLIPYLYRPCSFEGYEKLKELEEMGLIIQPIHPIQRWAPYYLTRKGKQACRELQKYVTRRELELVKNDASFSAHADFYELLAEVYERAPEFAENSVVSI